MLTSPLEVLTVIFAIITGTSAGLLALLSLEILRRSPIGRAMVVFTFTLLVFIVYHILVLLVSTTGDLTSLLPSVMYTTVAVVVWMVVLVERRMERHQEGAQDPS